MPAVLLVPGLLDVGEDALAACAPLARVAARAGGERCDDAEAALLHALGCNAAVAPLAALGAGLAVGAAWIARADPVTTRVSHDDVRIVARVDDLGEAEALALLDHLNRHFADDGLAFLAPRRDAWFVRSPRAFALTTVPLAAAVERPLRERLPAGADARLWRRWWTETQMLLHAEPAAQRARAPVDALWFADAGTLPRAPLPSLRAFATAGREGDVLRGIATLATLPCAAPDALDAAALRAPAPAILAVVADRVRDATTLDRFAVTLLSPLLAALDRGALDRLDLIAEGRADAARWTLARTGLLWRLWPRRATFAAPPREDA